MAGFLRTFSYCWIKAEPFSNFHEIFENIYVFFRQNFPISRNLPKYFDFFLFITPNISRCRAKKLLYRPTTGRKSNLITLWTWHVSHHHGWVRFQVSDRKLVNHTTEMNLWSIILIVNNLLWAFKDSTPLPILWVYSQGCNWKKY